MTIFLALYFPGTNVSWTVTASVIDSGCFGIEPRRPQEKRGSIAVLKLYMDESGIHDGSPVVTVAGYFAIPKKWREFTKDWNKAKRPIRVFHAADCASCNGEFKGWEPPARDQFVAGLLPIIPKHALPGICVGIHLGALEQGFAKRPELREMFGTPYTACFQWSLQFLLSVMERVDVNDRLAIIHEMNDYKHEVLSAFDWVSKNRKTHNGKLSISFGSKKDYVPLQAADVLAYEFNKRLRDLNRPPRRAWTALDPEQKYIKTLQYGIENMPNLLKGLSDLRDDLLAQGWDGKIAV